MSRLLRFGVFEVDLESRELRKRGIRLHLPEQSFEILAMLLERPGEVVTREEIRGRLWPHGTVVEFEHSVNSAVKRLRDCLGDSATSPRFIETLPRRGYRFVGTVDAAPASFPSPRSSARDGAADAAPSIPHFRILEKIGHGGMGVVFKAEDLVLGRTVALKFLPDALARHPPAVERFRREARTLASLNHPGICALHGVEEHEGRVCLVMEYLEGKPLSRLLEGGPLPLKQALSLAVQVAEALAAAHALGIAHHDVTPSNVFVGGEGRVKVLDFGLAEIVRRETARGGGAAAGAPAGDPAGPAGSGFGEPAAVDGSTDYLSPEQLRGEAIDVRTDIYSLGVVLYEMLCGRHPFQTESGRSMLEAVLEEEPPPPRTLRHDIPKPLERVVRRCLAKQPEQRYESAQELHRDLSACIASARSRRSRRAAVAAALVLLAGVAGFFGVRGLIRASRARWLEREALPEVVQLIHEKQPLAALELIQRAERLVPQSAELVRLEDRLPTLSVSITTTPAGADISVLDYANGDDRDASRWRLLGRSPLDAARLPAGDYRVRAAKDGFDTVELLFELSADRARTLALDLHVRGTAPPRMVWIPGTGPEGLGKTMFPASSGAVPGFWLDRHEVTNREFKQFVDAGGYEKREHWKEPFFRGGEHLTWEQAMAAFVDPSGRAGPASWELGSYPEGKGDHPVTGVSWFEAAAYAEFAGKSLPTVHQWLRAAGVGAGSYYQVLSSSNFDRKGTAPVAFYRGLGPFGTFDMAGNAREWCWNAAGSRLRFVLGGGFDDPGYQLTFPSASDPFTRSVKNGFRCAKNVSVIPTALTGEVLFVARDRRGEQPATDEAYRIFRDLHSYDRTDLQATVESSDDSPPYWRRERVSFRAAYDNERVLAHLYLPRNATPPYQVVVHFPGSTALVAPTADAPGVTGLVEERIVRSGRAVVLPAYKGTLERGPSTYYHWLGQPNRWRDMNLQWTKDLRRTIDYLQTRGDVQAGRIAFLGYSLGAAVGPVLVAVEPRFKAAILMLGGSFEKVPPEVDPWNFASRVKVPVLMLNGRDDFLFPVASSQIPLFRLLGTPAADKKHVVYAGAHDVYARLDVAKEMLDWLDRYLGPVTLRRDAAAPADDRSPADGRR
jgi:eukaryotic-like serine/threonine-protein kinase